MANTILTGGGTELERIFADSLNQHNIFDQFLSAIRIQFEIAKRDNKLASTYIEVWVQKPKRTTTTFFYDKNSRLQIEERIAKQASD